ncbi:MAG: hypothetical protein J6B62_06175 [Bacteroidales bacterium]|jgi:hypothetical protein|nr:hypothetical protein [Bacteroidales bacterium]
MEGFEKPIEDIVLSSKEYMDLKVDDLKLRTTEGLALAFSKFSSTMLLMTVLTIVLITGAFGGVLLIGDLLGNYAAGAFIVTGIFAIAFLILFCFRDKLFLNSFIKLFIRIFYGDR